jgi:galactose oxidase
MTTTIFRHSRVHLLFSVLIAMFACSFSARAQSTSGTEIVAVNSGQCLQAANASTATDTAVVQQPCAGLVAQQWMFAPIGSYYHIVSQNSQLCLNVSNGSTTAGATLIQSICQSDTSFSDQWSLQAVGNYYHIISRVSGQCVNISHNSTQAGGAVIQWTCQGSGALNDQFYVDVSNVSPLTLPSVWSPVIPLAVNAIGVANLPNGNLLLWSADQQFSFKGDIGTSPSQTYTGIFNPRTNTSSQNLVTSPGSDMFCVGTSVLPDGTVLINGGSSSPRTTLYNPANSTWTADADMNIPRGYEADALLSNGSVLTFGGSWSGTRAFKNGEVWTRGLGWTIIQNLPDNNAVGPDPQGVYRGDNHMWLFAQSNGMVFQAGPSAQMNWIDTKGIGSIQSAGNRGSDPFSINGNAVLYDIGKILKVGGAPAYQQNGSTTTFATNSAYLIDISQGPNAPVNVQQLPGMAYKRAFSTSVVLPDGSVVVIGGQSIPQPFTDTTAVLTPEIWSPVTKTFSLLNPMETPRTYHSTAILLFDGRVFVGGGGQCGTACAQNHLSAEILTPPYLLKEDGSPAKRPTITDAPDSARLGRTIRVRANGTGYSFVLMRLSADTHTVNNDQRRIPLTALLSLGKSYSLIIPSDPGVVLPGNYMLFALNAAGVPSVSTIINIQ